MYILCRKFELEKISALGYIGLAQFLSTRKEGTRAPLDFLEVPSPRHFLSHCIFLHKELLVSCRLLCWPTKERFSSQFNLLFCLGVKKGEFALLVEPLVSLGGQRGGDIVEAPSQ